MSASKSTQPASTFAALFVTPSMTTAGKPTPTGTVASMRTSVWIFLICRAIEAMTAAGADGDGGRHAVTRADQLAGVEVDRRRLDPGAADVHADRDVAPRGVHDVARLLERCLVLVVRDGLLREGLRELRDRRRALRVRRIVPPRLGDARRLLGGGGLRGLRCRASTCRSLGVLLATDT